MGLKEFIVGACCSAAIGWWLYASAQNDALVLKHQLRQKEVEWASKELKTMGLIYQIAEYEKENIDNYNQIVRTTKQYAEIIDEDFSEGKYQRLREMLALYAMLGNHSMKIESNNRRIYEAIRDYVHKDNEALEF